MFAIVQSTVSGLLKDISSFLVGKNKDKKYFYTDAKDIELHADNGFLNHSLSPIHVVVKIWYQIYIFKKKEEESLASDIKFLPLHGPGINVWIRKTFLNWTQAVMNC